MNCYVFTREPAGTDYSSLVDFCCAIASTMILVVRDPTINPGTGIEQLLLQLRPYCMDVALRREWPGTILYADDATVYSYSVTVDLCCEMKRAASRLFQWVHPGAPEDPCFFREDGRVALVTISHEREAYMMLEDSEYLEMERQFPDLVSILEREKDSEPASDLAIRLTT